MPEDFWQMAEGSAQEPVAEPRRRSTAVRVGRAVAVAAAFATIGIGGVAWASAGNGHQATTPSRVTVHDASFSGTAAHHNCPFHSQSSTSTASAQG